MKKLLTSLLAGATLTLSGLSFIPEANANDRCAYGEGYSLCFDYSDPVKDYYVVTLRNNHTTERMQVQCNGARVVDWRSNGGATQQEAEYLASYVCGL